MIRYSCNKGAHGITADAVRCLHANVAGPPSVLENVPRAMYAPELDKMAKALFDHELDARKALARQPAYVLNKLSWVLHRCFPEGDLRNKGRTLCGANFANWRSIDKLSSIPNDFPHAVGSRCCKATSALQEEDSSSDDSPTG